MDFNDEDEVFNDSSLLANFENSAFREGMFAEGSKNDINTSTLNVT